MATAVIMDIMSIQDYVFGSNALKENLGASYIVEHFYDRLKPFRGYTGGGNAFLLFDSTKQAEKAVKDFMLESLVQFPGVVTACAWDDGFDENNFRKSADRLFEKLRENKNMCIPATFVPAHGITSECPRSGLSGEMFYRDEKRIQFISSTSASKIAFSENAASAASDFLVKLGLGGKYSFTVEIDKLGQEEDSDSHIAVVHVDGNDMGEKFKACQDLKDIETLSGFLKNAVEKSFLAVISAIDSEIGEMSSFLRPQKEKERTILPLRPIIMGGDDVTFVCEGRMGIYFASLFMKSFEKYSAPSGEKLTSCAGVAVVKTKYPFFRAYQLAEELCRNAKKKRKEDKNTGSSYLDFHVSSGGITGSLEEMRCRHYVNGEGYSVLMRPYSFENMESSDGVLASMKHLKKSLAGSRIKELQKVLTLNEGKQSDFMNHLKFRGEKIPDRVMGVQYNQRLFLNQQTPFFDMVELMDIIPGYVIEKGGSRDGKI